MTDGVNPTERYADYMAGVRARGDGPGRSRAEYLRQRHHRDDLLDTAMLGGVELSRLLDGTADIAQIDARVTAAFRAQYPDHDLGEALRHAAGSEERLGGLVSAIKGKLFETEYVRWLNQGHLPRGYSAHLAASPTQPGWDIEITDAYGAVAEQLQAKTGEGVAQIREALGRYPGIDVVTTREAFDHLHDPDLLQHVRESTLSDAGIEADVRRGLQEAVEGGFHLPLLAFAVIALQTALRWRYGREAIEDVLREAARRGLRATVSSLASQGIVLVTGEPVVGPAMVFGTRLALARWAEHRGLVAGLDAAAGTMRGLTARLAVGSQSQA